ncbi:GNAT family N-acetyltransferase [Aspergillus fischeri NRRL 181]|uniref:GNAT family acetyltransferase, putative n=1 Tax=Neosartorya fischeri (strain ATCC 1020 / DSM 3700 / CBS 544.65 / FGSC A1164 / JCM 1740 / NRRL 181 / WB 181) TaxID=331117 RepID=A1DCG8_NEOFI|nr:GNAT family acetyltransferase, putative [Aspergillus fischeri NRRL 181]EAW19528.1 GNAT family acetyltransferase, putative [Aspergillus fischeri NRRL 181]KAG2021804.1 hypothetical protein GB937_004352 [Aspergillus fischeri]
MPLYKTLYPLFRSLTFQRSLSPRTELTNLLLQLCESECNATLYFNIMIQTKSGNMPTPAMHYRLATPSDAPQIQHLVQSAFRAPDTRPNWTGDTALASAFRIDTAEILSKITTPDSAFLLATDPTGALIACIGVSRCTANDNLARFFLLAVDEAYQRFGIGRKILAYAEEYAHREWGVRRGGLNALSTREELILWYLRCGYQLTGEVTPFPFERFAGMELPENLCFLEMEKALVAM